MIFWIFQIMFDAVLLFGFLFMFHFLYQSNTRREKNPELDRAQDVVENLKELLIALGKTSREITDDMQEKMNEAESLTNELKKMGKMLGKNLNADPNFVENELAKPKKKSLIESIDKVTLVKSRGKKAALKMKMTNSRPKLTPQDTTFIEEDLRLSDVTEMKKERVKEVYDLADESVSVSEIVHRTNLTKAEVQLILNLRKNRFTA